MPRFSSLLLLLSLCACRIPPAPSERAKPQTLPAKDAPTLRLISPPAILSAQLSRIDDPELGGLDGLLVVFNMELDAAAMRPRAFVVSRADAGPVWPKQAILAPASEDDENRSVMLVGDFGEAAVEHQPTHVAVSGSLFAEDGTKLQGLGASVLPFTAPPQVVAFQVLRAGPGRCEGAAQLLRTYWSAELRGVEPNDLERVRVKTSAAESVHPLRFDDHALEHEEAGQDNVLDLCMGDAAPVQRVWVDAGAFHDIAGHQSATIELHVDDVDG